jgi:ATP-dependent DNA ligase
MHGRLDQGAVKLLTRTGLDWTPKYPAIAKAVAAGACLGRPSAAIGKRAST